MRDSDLAGALHDHERENAIDSDGGQKHRNRREAPEQPKLSSALGERIGHEIFHASQLGDGMVFASSATRLLTEGATLMGSVEVLSTTNIHARHQSRSCVNGM